MINGDDIHLKKRITAYGLNSLVAVELRNSISKMLEASVPLMELMSSTSMEQLPIAIATKSELVDQSLLAEDAVTREGQLINRNWISQSYLVIAGLVAAVVLFI